MRVSHSIVSLLLGAFSLLVPDVTAHSKARDGIVYVSEVEGPVINTRSGRVDHLSDFDLTFHLHSKQQKIKLYLTPNHDIISENAHVQYLDNQGNVLRSEEILRHEHKVFKGVVLVEDEDGEWQEVGRARIYVKEDGSKPLMEGSFDILGDHHHVQLRSAYSQMRRRSDIAVAERKEESMIVYRDSDMLSREEKRDDAESETPSCGADNLAFNVDSGVHPRSASVGSFYSPSKKRQSGNIGTGNLRASMGSTAGCPTEARVALVGIATDCTYTAVFNGDQEALRQNLITMVNSASDAYENELNIALGLRNVTISEAICPSSTATSTPWNLPCAQGDIESRLDSFSQWRGQLGDDNAYWTMMSTCASGRSVGLAWLGQLCVSSLTGYGQQSVSGANVVVRTAGEWQVFAHESGHTFGAVHDCDASQCASSSTASRCCPASTSSCDANGAYLMSPVSSRGLTSFSPCSIGNICSGLGANRVRSSCLVSNRNLITLTGSQCGNGIVESGEDCDCGGESGCRGNTCCNPTTCRFIGSSVCDDSNDSCCTSCQFTPANTVCRASTGVCDREETCSGRDGSCPSDSFLPNGNTCGASGSGLACASGKCTSRDLQCQNVADVSTNGNYTEACNTNSCTLTCVSSSTSAFCSAMDQFFLDGTPCSSRGGQTCSNGRCTSSSSTDNTNNNNNGNTNTNTNNNNNNNNNPITGSDTRSWIDRNRSLFIGLVAGIGGLFLLSALCCIVSCCRKRSKRRKVAAIPPPTRPMVGGWGGNAGGGGGGWGPAPPTYPNQVHTGYDPRLARTPTFRYA